MIEINEESYQLAPLAPLTLSQENEIIRDLYDEPNHFGSDFEDIGLGLIGIEESVNLTQFVSSFDAISRNESSGPIKQEEPEGDGYLATMATGKLPCREPFLGRLQFELDISTLTTRSCLYSSKLNKLFTTMGSHCPMKFKWVSAEKETLFLRAVPLYLDAQDLLTPVERCMIHASECKNIHLDSHPYHVVRAGHVGAQYDTDPESERMSVLIPLDRIQPGSDSVTVLIAFMCKNSCAGGMNRRSTEVIFTLENSLGLVLGRASVQFRVCSCPKRDMEKEERDQAKAEKRSFQEAPQHSSAKRRMRVIVQEVTAKHAKLNSRELIYIPVLEAMASDVVTSALGLLLAKGETQGFNLTPQQLELKKQYIELLNSERKEQQTVPLKEVEN